MAYAVVESMVKIFAPITKSFAGAFVCLKKLGKKLAKYGTGLMKIWQDKVAVIENH